MRIWIYGENLEQIREVTKKAVCSSDIVVGSSIRAEPASAFPKSGLTPAVSAAIRGEIDLLLIPAFESLGNAGEIRQAAEWFQRYGVSIRSACSSGISSS
ncbi:MAG: hypothetical protein NC489_26945 [Ruminococcus flavefaciens]|nr:hypothetical protein [Ruminococcus flavefaciens]